MGKKGTDADEPDCSDREVSPNRKSQRDHRRYERGGGCELKWGLGGVGQHGRKKAEMWNAHPGDGGRIEERFPDQRKLSPAGARTHHEFSNSKREGGESQEYIDRALRPWREVLRTRPGGKRNGRTGKKGKEKESSGFQYRKVKDRKRATESSIQQRKESTETRG